MRLASSRSTPPRCQSPDIPFKEQVENLFYEFPVA